MLSDRNVSFGVRRIIDLMDVACGAMLFRAAWTSWHAHARLDLEADEIDGGHYITLSRPRELAERLAAYAAAVR